MGSVQRPNVMKDPIHSDRKSDSDDDELLMKYVRGEIVPMYEMEKGLKTKIRERKKDHEMSSMSKRTGTHRIKRKVLDENVWFIVPTKECEREILEYIKRKYRYNEIYEKDTTKVWHGYNGEPIVIIRCYGKQKSSRFYEKLRQWISDEPFESDPNREYTKRPRMIRTSDYHIIMMTDHVIPKDLRSKFRLGNIKNPRMK